MNVPINISNVYLHTKRLILRHFVLSDLDDFYDYAKVDGVGQMAGWLPHKNKEESLRLLNNFIEEKKTFAIEYQGKVIGSLGIDEYDEAEYVEFSQKKGREIGYVLAKEYWGKGLMPEALNEVIRYLFEELKLDFLACAHFTDNPQSRRVQEKCGFRHYKLSKQETRYGIVKDSWLSILDAHGDRKMIKKNEVPVLEFDDCKDAVINPNHIQNKHKAFPFDKLVIAFFKEAIDKMLQEGIVSRFYTMGGENPYDVYQFKDNDVLLVHGRVGCPACGGMLEELIALGIKKVIFCGGGGVLDRTIAVGKLMVVEGAIRDEGFSYQYIKPSRVIYTQKNICNHIANYLEKNKINYFKGLSWTTDAFYRETRNRVELRKEEGAKIVEMEQAGCIAVSLFRDIKYGAIIYGGDDVSSLSWDERSWRSRHDIRYDLIHLCKNIVLSFDDL